MSFCWVSVGIPPGDFRRSCMALRWAAVGITPGYYSAIVADVVLIDHPRDVSGSQNVRIQWEEVRREDIGFI